MYMYAYTYTHIYIYIYVYKERSTEKHSLKHDPRLLSFPKANHNTTSERGFCFVSGRIPQTNARMALVVKLDGNWNSLPQGQCIFVQLWTRVRELGASMRVCAGIKETHSACDGVCAIGVVKFIWLVMCVGGCAAVWLCANLVRIDMLPQRVCRSQQCARLGQHVLASEPAQDGTAPKTN